MPKLRLSSALRGPISRSPPITGTLSRKYAMAATSHLERFYADKTAPYCSLNVKQSFELLTTKEKLYAHYLGKYVTVRRR